MKYIIEKEDKKGFTLIKVDYNDNICGRFVYELGQPLAIANATMCKRGILSKQVTSIKLGNFFAEYDCAEDVGFKNPFFKDIIEFANRKYRNWGYGRGILPEYFTSPVYEILIKAGYKDALMVYPPRIMKRDGKTPGEILGMTKIQLKIYKEYHIDVSDTEDSNFLVLYYNSIKNSIAEDLQKGFYRWGVIDDTNFLYKFHGYKIDKLIDYAGNVCRFTQGITSPREVLQLLRDLNKMYKDMDMKVNEKYPKSLKMQHDLTMMRHNICISEIQENKYSKIRTEKGYLEFDTDKYIFILPKDLEDIKQEGKILSHCVGCYCSRVSEGNTNIIFMRSKNNPEDRLITIEVSNSNYVFQARGEHNRNLKNIEELALNEYESYLSSLDIKEVKAS